MVFAVVTGGGTSGHVIPALAIIEALQEHGVEASNVKYVGSRRGIETTLMAQSNVESVFLPVSGFQRGLSVRALLRNCAFVFRLVRSRWMAQRILKKWRPAVVVSVGGYASAPIAMAAHRQDIPLVCVSYDRIAGLATKRQARYATTCAVAFPDSSLPRAVHTGAPIRSNIRHLDLGAQRSDARMRLGIPATGVCMTVVGGSLGSTVLNKAVQDILNVCQNEQAMTVFHICGSRNETDAMAQVPPSITYVRRGYESAMADLYAASDLIVCRAGASTVAEIAAVGIASIIVPWSGASDNHQSLNAQWLSDHDAAVVLTEEQLLTPDGLDRIVELIRDDALRRRIAQHAYELGATHRGNSLVMAIQNATR